MENDIEFATRFNVPNISTVKTEIKSTPYVIAGLSWQISIDTRERAFDQKWLSVYIYCDSTNESPFWSCDANIEICLIPLSGFSFSRIVETKFSVTSKARGHSCFMDWNTLFSPLKEYISNDCITVEAKFKISVPQDVPSYSNFDTFEDNLTDITLIVNETKLHVSKVYLSLYSPVFRKMFFSKHFEENDMKEITLDEDLEEFIEMLRVIYPCRKPIDEINVKYILKLADKYEMKDVMDKCENYLTREHHFPTIKKLILADQYKLKELQNRVIQKLRKISDIKWLQTKKDYNLLSDATKAALFDRILQFV